MPPVAAEMLPMVAQALDLSDAVFGRTVEIEANKLDECEVCHGRGIVVSSSVIGLD